MGTLFTIIILIACVALILFVLVQNPKGGGLNAEFGSAVQLGGAKRATDILEKGTWTLALAIAIICLGMAAGGNSTVAEEEDGVKTDVNSIESDAATSGEAPQIPSGGLPGLN